MTELLIHHVRAMRPGVGIVAASVRIRDGRIAELSASPTIDRDAGPDAEDVRRIDGQGRLLTPGLIDIHTHGIGQHLYEAGPEDLRRGLRELPRFGVTTVLPTFYRVMDRPSLPRLVELAQALAEPTRGAGGLSFPRAHLEGPFLALPGAGAATVPGDLDLLDALLDAMGGRLAAMSVSPDTPNILPVIERLRERGVAVFMTHTRASVEQTMAAIDAGVTHATHFYDVFPVPAEHEPGVRPVGAVEAVLADDRVSVDFIADGVHVHPTAIHAALKAKGPQRVLLITDANIGAGLQAGVYDTAWGYPVRVTPGDAARIEQPGSPNHGMLAGSALTMDRGVSNLLHWLDLPVHDIWAMATRSVGERLGLAPLGDLCVGAPADLVLWDQTPTGDDRGELRAARTWIGGEPAYERFGDLAIS